MEVKLKDVVVKIKDSLTWGDSKKIQSAIMKGAKVSGKAGNSEVGLDFNASVMLEGTYTTLECSIIEIIDGGVKKEFTREWMDSLSISDGDKLVEAVDEMSKKK